MAELIHARLQRSIARMAIHVTRESQKKAKEHAAFALRETEQQFQVALSGFATSIPVWATITVTFNETIYMAPFQRDSTNEEPQLFVGKVISSGPPVFIECHVVSWVRDVNGDYLGATVRVGAYDPSNSRLRYSGRLHLTFQAMSAPVDVDEPSGDASNNVPLS